MNIHETLYQVDPRDNVAVALVELHSGSIVRSAQSAALSVRERIPQGHKIALQAIPAGETIYRYGFPIGTASEEIAAGAWVHTHNVGLAEIHRSFAARPQTAAQTITPPIAGKTFMGYHRPNGTVGTRNFIGIISTINCANQTVRALARHFNQPGTALPPNVDGVLPIVIPMGCSIETGGEDHLRLQQTLLNLARNPNLFGCVFIGLGCEVNLMGEVLAERGIPYLAIQEENSIGNTVKKGIEIVEQLIAGAAKVKRAEAPIAALRLAFQCGGSDAYSGITANPLMGRVSDWVCSLGASTLTGETTEIFGAEQLLTCRVANEAVGAKFVRILERWQEEADRFGFSIDNNPSPGNKMGGLTNIYEKSLGAIAKCGTLPISAVYEYGEWMDAQGACFLDTPGNDALSITGQMAAGCNLILFSTGRGTVWGSGLVPTIKLATNSPLYQRMTEEMDFNAGALLEGVSMDALAEALIDQVLAVASGQWAKNEAYHRDLIELYPWRRGAIV